MPKYDNHTDVIVMIKAAQEAEQDQREQAKEADLFLNKRDGQWEPYWWEANNGKPRYTFDLSNPIVDQIAGEIEQADFDIKVDPAGGDATDDIAETYDGLIRNIENISGANNIYNMAARSMVASGIDGWRIVQDYVDDDSFDQDLLIKPVSNFKERVWFDPASERQDKSDARWAVVLQSIPLKDYEERWPEGSGMSVSNNSIAYAYCNQKDEVIVGELYYIKEKESELVLMSNGATYRDDEDFKKVKDELLALGIQEVRRRKRKQKTVYTRKFDASDWLDEEAETVFQYIPVIPCYANFKIFENKTTYWGAIEKILDSQRVLNYSLSREIEEGALAPRAKYWGTPKQAAGFEDSIGTLNTNSDPWQFYNPDPEAPGAPQQQGGAQINPGLRNISDAMGMIINQSAGLFAANMGDNPNAQSGVAIERLQNKGDTGTIKYFKAMEVALSHTARILIKAIPRVYEAGRQIRLLGADGTSESVTIGQQVQDVQTGQIVTLHDLSQGTYDVTRSAGPAFKNRQQETVQAIIEMAGVDPSIMQLGGDIMLRNTTAPGMNEVADRKRIQLINAGMIPDSQLTQEEMAQVQAMRQQPQQPDAMMVAAEAEMAKAQADQAKVQLDTQKEQINAQIAQAKLQQEQQRIDLDREKQQLETLKAQLELQEKGQKLNLEAAKVDQGQQKIDLEKLVAVQEQSVKQQEVMLERMNSYADYMNTQADTLNKLREAIGADTVVGPVNTIAYSNQAEEIVEEQEKGL